MWQHSLINWPQSFWGMASQQRIWNIWNMDETGLTKVQNPGCVVATKGERRVGSVTFAERGVLVTMALAGNTLGNITPPPILSFPEKSISLISSDVVQRAQLAQPMVVAGCRSRTLSSSSILFSIPGQQKTIKSCSCWTTTPLIYQLKLSTSVGPEASWNNNHHLWPARDGQQNLAPGNVTSECQEGISLL